MKKLLLLVFAYSCYAQTTNPSIVSVTVAPSGACSAGLPNRQVLASGVQYSCQAGTWAAIAGGGAIFTPTGIQYATSTTAATVATSNQIQSAIGTGIYSPAAQLPASLASGLLGDWNFYQQTGTTLTDSSGNGNNGTLTGGATFSTTGLPVTTTQGASIPVAVNTAQTFVVALYLDTLNQNTSSYSSFNSVVVSSAANPGTNLFLVWTNTGSVAGAPSPSVYSSGSLVTGCINLVSGYHVIAWTLGTSGTSLDHFYVDGQECAYQSQNANAGTQVSGFLNFGAATTGGFANNGMPGIFYRARAYSRQLSATEVQELTQFFNADVSSRGVYLGTSPVVSPNPNLFCVGDSITEGVGVTNPFCSLLSLANQPTYTIENYGIPAITMQEINASEPNRIAPQCRTTSGPANVVLTAGTNDFGVQSFGNTAQAVWNSAAGAVVSMTQAGCRVFVGTMLSRTGSPSGSSTTFDQYKDAYDSIIITNAKAIGAVGVVDFAANPLLGADLASTNPNPTACSGGTCFQSDGIHPTEAGQQLMANAMSNTFNYYFGSNIGNPTTVTSNTYQMLSGDGAIIAAPTGTAAYTLPDCTGPSGAIYTINNPQAVNVLTIIGKTNQPINGSALALTIPSNSTVTLRDVANSKTVSGCQWAM